MRVLDLFSGIGGFSLGLERAGFTTVAFCEIDPYARAVLRKHWPDVPCYDDVRTVTAARLAADGIIATPLPEVMADPTSENAGGRREFAEDPEPADRKSSQFLPDPCSDGRADTAGDHHRIDVICGGFPCQDISHAGKGAGLAGERSGLWSEIARLVGELRPRYVIVENVAALLGRGLDVVLGDLAEIGYDAEWHCIPASYVGAPHRRDRIWIVAYPGSPEWREGNAVGRDSRWQDGSHVQRQKDSGWTAQCGENVADADQPRLEGRLLESLRECASERTAWPSSAYVADSDTLGLQVSKHEPSEERPSGTREWARSPSKGWWSIEPDVCGMVDGLSEGLDGGLNAGQRVDSVGRQTVVSEASLRTVWKDIAARSASQGPQPDKQLARELADRVLGLPYTLALAGGQGSMEAATCFLHRLREAVTALGALPDPSKPTVEAWLALSGEAAEGAFLAACGRADWRYGEWPGVPRVANGVPKRVDRLRCLGNAVVPQIPEILGRAIMAAEGLAAP